MKYKTQFLKPKKSNDIELYQKLITLYQLSEFILDKDHSCGKLDGIYPIESTTQGYSDVFLVYDSESDNPCDWRKLKLQNEDLFLYDGDLIIKFK